MSRSRQIAINAASQWGVTILSAALGLVLVPFLIAKLGKDGYGLIAVIMALAGVCALADLGISAALGRQLAEALAEKDDGKYRELFSTALALNLLMGMACALAVFVLARQLATAFALPDSLFGTGVFLIRTYGAAHVLFTFLMPAAKAVLASHNRFDTSSQIDAVRRLCETVGLFLVLAGTNVGIAGWAVVCLTADAVCTFMLWHSAYKAHAGLTFGLRMSLSRTRELFVLGGQFSMLQIGGQLSVSADPFILTSALGPASVSLYRPPAQVLGALSPIVMTLANQLHPLATKAHVDGDKADLALILFRGTKYTMMMGSVLSGTLLPFAYPLCKVWLGGALGEQYKICAALLVIQTITSLCAFGAGTQWPVLLGMKRIALAAGGRFALGIVNIASSWILVHYTGLGVLGVVLPTLAIEILWRPVIAIHVCAALGVPVLEYFRQSYLTPFVAGGVVAIAGFGLRWITQAETLGSLVLLGIVVAAVAALAIWVIGFNQQERAAICRLMPVFHN